jgi:hypothetical protein
MAKARHCLSRACVGVRLSCFALLRLVAHFAVQQVPMQGSPVITDLSLIGSLVAELGWLHVSICLSPSASVAKLKSSSGGAAQTCKSHAYASVQVHSRRSLHVTTYHTLMQVSRGAPEKCMRSPVAGCSIASSAAWSACISTHGSVSR